MGSVEDRLDARRLLEVSLDDVHVGEPRQHSRGLRAGVSRQRPRAELAARFVRDRTDDDTSLLVAEDATLSYKDVIKKTVAQLLIMSGEDAGTVIPLVESEYHVGRMRENQIQLNDLGVSARHARIFRGPEGYVVEDLKSRNGTWLNGTRICFLTSV